MRDRRRFGPVVVAPSSRDHLWTSCCAAGPSSTAAAGRASGRTWASWATGSSPSATCRTSMSTSVATVVDCTDRIVAPGFIDPHGHSDGSLFVDGALASHLHQGFTTQLSGNCGDTPRADRRRRRASSSSWRSARTGSSRAGRTFAEYLDRVDEQALGPNVAFLVGHGTVRGSVLGAEARPRDRRGAVGDGRRGRGRPRRGRDRAVDRADLRARACTPSRPRWRRSSRRRRRRGGLYATHMRNESDGLFASLDESIAAVRAAGSAGAAPGLAPQVRRAVGLGPGRRRARPARGGPGGGSRRRRPTSTRTRPPRRPSRRSCRPRSRASASTPAWRRSPIPHVRDLVRVGDRARHLRLGERGRRPGLGRASRISLAASHPGWAGRSLAELADELHADPLGARLRCPRRRPARRLGRHRVHVRAGRRDDHGRALDRGLHGCRRPAARAPDPRCRPAAPAGVRQHGPGPRALRRATAASCRSRRRSRS